MKLVVGRDDLAAAALAAVRLSGTSGERVEVRPVHKESRGFVNDASVDVCEVAIVTLLQAAAYDKRVVLLPITTLGRFQHQTLVTMGELTADEVEGRSVGVRSWSQTTGVWVRGFLAEQYGVDLRKVDWTVYESAHVDEYEDPKWCAARWRASACSGTSWIGASTSGSWAANCRPTSAFGLPSPTLTMSPHGGHVTRGLHRSITLSA